MTIIERDLQHLWHPCSQMKDYETFPPIEIVKAYGSYLETAGGGQIIDAISSWWCKSLGHQHPRLKQALISQLDKIEHVILANTTNETVVKLSERLAKLTPNLNKVMYASDGSCVIEMALKMSIHARQLQDQPQRKKIMSLQNGYHGETTLALAVSDCGIYRKPYESILPEIEIINNIPYVNSIDDPLWEDCSEHWSAIEQQLSIHANELTAIIFEPILQGAGGMQIYSKDFLVRLRSWTKQHDIHLVADEIMTGFGRTGHALAIDHAGIEPDFLCLAKGLTAGMLPLSAMLTSTKIYNLFYDDYAKGTSFLHSHTHTGNTLACAVANACLDVMTEEKIYQNVQENSHHLLENMLSIAQETGKLKNIRHIGWMIAADIVTSNPRGGYAVYQKAVELGALLRPLGNTIYWLPPLNTSLQTLNQLRDITCAALLHCHDI